MSDNSAKLVFLITQPVSRRLIHKSNVKYEIESYKNSCHSTTFSNHNSNSLETKYSV